MGTAKRKRIKKKATGQAFEKTRQAVGRPFFSFSSKFSLSAAILMILISLVPEAWYTPLNRFTALLAGEFLRLSAEEPVVHGANIYLNGFSVNVISECSAVHLAALFGAFLYAFPATPRQKWIGFGAGTALLLVVNVIRIAAVTWIGWRFPKFFEPAHVYLGQLAMLMVMMGICLRWCRWISDPGHMDGPAGFLVRFIAFSGVLFLLWVPLNRTYMGAVDRVVHWIFGLASYHLVIPRTHALYYQSFSLIALVGLLLAVKGAEWKMRLRWIAYGIGALTMFQLSFRLCNVWLTAFKIDWMAPLSQTMYAICVYALPPVMGLRFFFRVRGAFGGALGHR